MALEDTVIETYERRGGEPMATNLLELLSDANAL